MGYTCLFSEERSSSDASPGTPARVSAAPRSVYRARPSLGTDRFNELVERRRDGVHITVQVVRFLIDIEQTGHDLARMRADAAGSSIAATRSCTS